MTAKRTIRTVIWTVIALAVAGYAVPGLAQQRGTGPVGPPGWTALHRAVSFGDIEAVKRLATPGKVDVRDNLQRTPLHIAALHDGIQTARILLDAGADIHALDKWNVTPLRRAQLVQQVRGFDRSAFMAFLRERGAER